jgi:outer membrane protein assembly factor BamA
VTAAAAAAAAAAKAALGEEGFAFAKVDPVPHLDEEKQEVSMTFLVDPGWNFVAARRYLWCSVVGFW